VAVTKLKTYRKYDKAFKLEAGRLVLEEGHSVRSVERKLGTSQGVVYGWVRAYNADPELAFPGSGKLKPPERKLRDLKLELERVKRERDILKKAVAIFSKDPDRYSGS
jgi:transposase